MWSDPNSLSRILNSDAEILTNSEFSPLCHPTFVSVRVETEKSTVIALTMTPNATMMENRYSAMIIIDKTISMPYSHHDDCGP